MGIHILFFHKKSYKCWTTFIQRKMGRWIHIWCHPWQVWFNSAIRRPSQSAPRYYQTYKIYLRVWRMWKWEFSSRWIHNFLCKQKCFKSCHASPYLLSAQADISRLTATRRKENLPCVWTAVWTALVPLPSVRALWSTDTYRMPHSRGGSEKSILKSVWERIAGD